jgi:hypothetical protein
VKAALALSAEEREDFLQRLGARDLAAAAEERTLAHLLLRADSISRARVDWRRLKVGGGSWACELLCLRGLQHPNRVHPAFLACYLVSFRRRAP